MKFRRSAAMLSLALAVTVPVLPSVLHAQEVVKVKGFFDGPWYCRASGIDGESSIVMTFTANKNSHEFTDVEEYIMKRDGTACLYDGTGTYDIVGAGTDWQSAGGSGATFGVMTLSGPCGTLEDNFNLQGGTPMASCGVVDQETDELNNVTSQSFIGYAQRGAYHKVPKK